MKLRKYQKTALKSLKRKLKKNNHVLFTAPTGAGKTVMFAKLCKPTRTTLILVPRIALLGQITSTLQAVGYDMTDVTVHHGTRRFNKYASVHIGMINTFYKRLQKYGTDYIGAVDRVMIDEVHIGHGQSMYQVVKDAYWDTAKWIGFSATPIDNKGYMLEGYDDVVHDIQTIDLVNQGYLLPLKIYKESSPDLRNVKMVGGDYNQQDLADEMSKGALVNNAYDVWVKQFGGKKTMIFCVNIDHAELVATKFREHDVSVVVSHSKNTSDANDKAHKLFSSGHAQVLISINKLTAGFDEPSVEVLFALRPTKTKSLYLQAVGRVLRPHPSMDEAILVDCAGWIEEFGHPFEKLELKRAPEKKEKMEKVEAKPKICIECKKECEFETTTQFLEDSIVVEKYCDLCGALNDQIMVEYRDVKDLEEVPNPANIESVNGKMVAEFVEKIRSNKGYKRGWVSFIARDAKRHPDFMEFLKEQRNKYKMGKINLDTALKNITLKRGDYET